MRSQNSKRLLTEACLKVDMLENEVYGLKQIVNDVSRNNLTTSQQYLLSKSTNIMQFLNGTCKYIINFYNFKKQKNLN